MEKYFEHNFVELGYFTVNQCKRIESSFSHKSYLDFEISHSNCAGNCILIVGSKYADDENEVKNTFLSYVLKNLSSRSISNEEEFNFD